MVKYFLCYPYADGKVNLNFENVEFSRGRGIISRRLVTLRDISFQELLQNSEVKIGKV